MTQTSPLPAMKVPTWREQTEAHDALLHARDALARSIALHSLDSSTADMCFGNALVDLQCAALALGLRVVAAEPAAQQPQNALVKAGETIVGGHFDTSNGMQAAQQPQSDLVKRLRAIADEFYEMCGDIHEPLREAAARIEALEAAAAQPAREAALVKAARMFANLTPSTLYPADGSQNEPYGIYLADQSSKDEHDFTGGDLARLREALAAYDTPAKPEEV